MSKYFIYYPSSEAINPFIRILSKELEKQGWIENKDANVWMNMRSIIRHRISIRVLYFHWPETFWRSNRYTISLVKSFFFIFHVYIWKIFGYKLVFSAHNVLPHFGKVRVKHELIMRKFIVKRFDLIIGHSYNTLFDLTDQICKPNNYVLALHGLYENIKEPEFKIGPTVKLFISYSSNEYKGINHFFSQLLSFDIKELRGLEFIIAGNIPDDLITQLSNHKIIFRLITSDASRNSVLNEAELENSILLSDFVILPYKKITNSGFYFLAITLGKGVLASNIPFFRLHSHEQTLLHYNTENSISLLKQLQKIKSGWRPNSLILKELQSKYSWECSAKLISYSLDHLIDV